MSIFRKTLSCAVLAALSTCALAGCGKLNPHLPKHSPWMHPRPSDSTVPSMWRTGS